MSQYLYLAELVAYVPGTRSLTTLRYATGLGHITGPAETPANTFYDARLQQPGTLTRTAFGPGRTSGRSVLGFGDLVLENADGELDPILEYGFDGRAVTVRRGLVGAAYPGGFTTIFAGTMEQVDAVGRTIVVKLRDKQADLDTPLQVVTYTGANVLPAGLEGNADDLKGKPKPVCYGNVENVPAPCVNTTKLIYQVQEDRANAVPITAISAVYDRGVQIPVGGVWTLDDAGFGSEDIYGLAYGVGVYVAVGTAGTLTSSPDADVWTVQTSQFGASIIYGVAFNGTNLFVAVGAAGKVSTSADGLTWTARGPLAGTPTLKAVVWASELSLWIAVGNTAALWTSTDGSAWTSRTSNYPTGDILGVAWNGSVAVAVGNQANIITSTDGTTWVNRSVPFAGTGTALAGIAYGNDRFIAVGTAWGSPTQTLAVSSYDGFTWTVLPQLWVGSSLYLPQAVTYGNGLWLVVGSGDRMASSRDGDTWTAMEGTSPYATNLEACCYGAGWLVGGDYNSNAAMFSKGSAYATLADLENDALAPRAGEHTPYLSGGYFRLGAPPAGLITADVEHGITNPALLWAEGLKRAGKVTGDWSASDVTTVSSAANLAIGFWQGPDGDATFSDLLTRIAESVGAWWGVDRTGVYRIKQLLAPSGTAVASFTANDLLRPPVRLALGADPTRGLPQWRTFLTYQHNYAVQTTDLAGSVSDVRRAFLALADREAVFEDTLVREAHLNAPESREDTLLQVAANALTEATRRQVMRGILRHRYELVVKLDDDTDTLDLGDVISLTHDRYGLSGGALFTVLGIAHDFRRDRVTLTVWGPSDPVSLLRLRAPVLSGAGTVT